MQLENRSNWTGSAVRAALPGTITDKHQRHVHYYVGAKHTYYLVVVLHTKDTCRLLDPRANHHPHVRSYISRELEEAVSVPRSYEAAEGHIICTRMRAESGLSFIARYIDGLSDWTGGILQFVGCICIRIHLAASRLIQWLFVSVLCH